MYINKFIPSLNCLVRFNRQQMCCHSNNNINELSAFKFGIDDLNMEFH